MKSKPALPPELEQALAHHLLDRLPLTFQPFFRQQLGRWQYLFPFEQRYLLRILTYLQNLNQHEFETLFRGILEIEKRMDLGHHEFVTSANTIGNASLLARSPYYQQWRQAVQVVFDRIDRDTPAAESARGARSENRLIMLILPDRLPIDPQTVWAKWAGIGQEIDLDLAQPSAPHAMLHTLFGASSEADTGKPRLLDVLAQRSGRNLKDVWAIEAGTQLWELLGGIDPKREKPAAMTLSWARLKAFREGLSEQINGIRKDLADADAVYARLRTIDVSAWCPPEIGTDPVVRDFTRELFLSGNGALIFGSAFVEWAAAENLRLARPSVLVACFGIRNKPKPFTSVAVFENQDKASPLPDVEDLPGSMLDAEVLARYVWWASARYPEYKTRTAILCLAENVPRALLSAPPDFPLERGKQHVKLERLGEALADWLT
ncbi:MAG TPA: hypothetical protein VG028_19490 [Terriglobia bacterium]|nr:hypothetical protein [Terriglobia bacterium]